MAQLQRARLQMKNEETTNSNGLVLTADHRDATFEHCPRPSELELAHLAARLARTEKIDPKQLVSEAWDLYWESCRKIQADHQHAQRMLQALEAQDDDDWEDQTDLPQPRNYPVKFLEMERLLLPKLRGRTADRATAFREYLLAEILKGCLVLRPEPRLVSYWDFDYDDLSQFREKFRETIDKRYGKLRQSTWGAKAYTRFAMSFLAWYHRWTRHRNSQIKSANARKGWDKRRNTGTAKTGARPKADVLREILENPLPGGLTGAESRKKR
jgi:hypothetical protein